MKKKFTSYTTSLAARPRSRRLRELGVAAAVAVSGATAASGESLIDDLFEKVENGTDANGNIKWAIRAKYGLFSNEFISTRGTSDDSGASGGGIDVTFLEDYLAGKSYATESWVSDKLVNYWTKAESDNRFQPKGNYLTQHQDISHLLSKTDAASLYQPKGNYLTQHQSLADYYTKSDADNRFVALKYGWDNGIGTMPGNGKAMVFHTLAPASNKGLFPAENNANAVLTVNTHVGNYNAQLGFSSNGNLYLRTFLNEADYSEHKWKTILDSGNYAATLDGRYYTKDDADGRYVDLSSNQAVGGTKTFTATVAGNYGFRSDGAADRLPWFEWHIPGVNYTKAMMTSDGMVHFVNGADSVPTSYHAVKALSFIRQGGTSAQFLKADGSVDSTSYLSRAGGSMTTTTVVTNLNADMLDGFHASRFTVYNTATNGNNVDFNAISYNRSTAITIQPIHTGNYTGYKNAPFGGYGQMLTFGGYDSLFPFRIAYRQDNHLYLQGGGYKTAESFTFENKTWETIAFLSDVYTKAEADGRYVNADGDDMTGVLTITTDTSGALNLKTETANAAPFMRFWQVGNAKTSVGWDSSNGSYIFNYASQKQLGITDDGAPHFNGNKLWHSGNDGSGSGLDADLLDGHHETEYFRNNIAVIAPGEVMTKLPGNRSGSYQVSSSGWYGSATVFYAGGSNSGLAFYRPGGSNSIPSILVATDSKSNWVDKGKILTSGDYASTLDARYVTLGTEQRITGAKTFTDIRLDGQGENVNMPFFLGIDAYKDGGAVKYITASKVAGAISVYTKAESDNKYVTKDDLAKMFTIVTEGGKSSIKAMMGLWSADWIATKGQSDSSGASGAGIDVTFLESYLKGDNADKAVYATQSWVGSAIDSKLTTYATQSWVNSQGFLKSHQSLANYVTLNTAQTITGMKTFASDIMMGDSTVNGCMIKWVRNTDWAQIWFKNASDSDTDSYLGFQTGDNGNEYFRFSTKMSGSSADTVWATIKSGGITANGFIKSGGTSTQALMADGSVRAVHTLSEVTNLGWSGTSGQLATINTLAYWDGAYQGVGSNLRYCSHGRFGDIVTHSHSEYVTTLGTNGNYLTWTKNGAVNNITVPYATKAAGLTSNTSSDYALSGVTWFDGDLKAGAAVRVNDSPTTAWWHILRFNHSNSNGFYTDLAVPFNNDSIYYKIIRNEAVAHGKWVKVLDELNYSSVLNNLYYTETEVNSLVGAKVSKAGDTMTGDLLFSNSGTGIRQIRFTMGDNDFSRIAVGATASNAGWMEIATADDGTEPIYVRQYSGTYTSIVRTATLLDGSGNTAFPGRVNASHFTANSTTLCTNLNADLLDGRHSNGFSWRKSIGMQSDTHGAYVLLCPAYDGTLLDGGFFYGTVYITRGNAGAFNAKTAVMVQCGGQYNANLAQYQVLSASVSILGLFKVKYNGTAYIALKMAPTSIMNFAVEGMWGGNSDPMVVNSDGAGVTEEAALSTTPQIASNAQSATRLQGTYKLWGRDFYGNDVDGAMIINYTGETGIALYRKEAGSGAFIRFYNASQTANYFRIGMFGDSRFGIGYNSGTDAINILTNGNVGIGTTAPAYKLDVNGTISTVALRTGGSFFLSRDGSLKIYTKDSTFGSETVCLQTCIDGADGETHDYVTSQAGRCIMALQPRGGKVTVGNIAASDYALTATSFLCDTWVRTSGQHGWFNQTYKGGWYMTDENWIRNYNNKSLYMTSATIRTDGRIEVGSNGSKFLVDSSGNVTTIGKLTLNLSGENIVSSFYKLNSTSNNPYLNLKIGSLDYYVQAYNSKLCMGPNASKGISVDHVGNVEMSGDARIYGNLLLKSDDNYGNRLNFGDGDFVYLSETEDDELHIYADQGIYLDSDGGYITIAENTGLSFFGAGLLSADTAMKAIRCSCGFYSDKFVSTKGTADLSDMRLKRVLAPMELKVEDIAAAPLFIHEWRNDPGSRALGSSAQYWEGYVPEAVHRLGDYRTMEYDKLGVAMGVSLSRRLLNVEARHSRWLGKHEARVQRLERRVRELEKELETLKNKEYAA